MEIIDKVRGETGLCRREKKEADKFRKISELEEGAKVGIWKIRKEKGSRKRGTSES